MSTSRTQVVKFLKQGEKGEQGATLRGPQSWSDCAVGYGFQSGSRGEAWKDVVIYGDNCYSCIKSHTKTSSNYPGSSEDSNNKLWRLGDMIELVATKILLSTYALVKNLGVEAIEMKDSNGNVVFVAKDGKVSCTTGDFKNIDVSGNITANTLKLKESASGGVVNGAMILYEANHYLPELAKGECQSIKWINPRITKSLITSTLQGVNSRVLIAVNGDRMNATNRFSTADTGYYELFGSRGSNADYTYWDLFEIKLI